MLFKDILLETYGEALAKKLKEGSLFTIDEVNEMVKGLMLEIDFWDPEIKDTPNRLSIEAKGSSPTFSVFISAIPGRPGSYGVKFGEGEDYSWETDRLLMIKKAEFLKRIARTIIRKKFLEGEIDTLVFAPVASDGRDEDRIRLFRGLYAELTSGIDKDFLEFNESDEEYSGSMTVRKL